MKFKRLAAGIAGIVACASVLTAMVVTGENAPKTEIVDEQSVENVIAEANANALGEESGCDILFVDMNGQTATVELTADKSCTLVVAAYDEDGVNMLSSAMSEISAGAETASVTFADELPDTYYIKAFLVDSESYAPLCEAYTNVFTSEDYMTSDEYFAANSTVSSIESVSDSNMYSEAEVAAFLHERGFDEEITYDFTAEGKMVLDGVVSAESEERHPQYETFYISEKELIWRILVIGKSVILYAADIDAQTYSESFLAESSVITSYDISENRFVNNTPNESVMKIKVMSRIDAAAIDSLTMEGIEAL